MAKALSRSGALVSAQVIIPVVKAARGLGIDLNAAVARVGKLSLSELEEPDARIPHELAMELLDALDAVADDRALGPHLAERIGNDGFGVVGYVARNSATLGEAATRVAEYAPLMHDSARFSLETSTEQVTFHFRLEGELRLSRTAVECFTALFVLVARHITGARLDHGEIHFRHKAPKDLSEHRRVFGLPLRFSAEHNAISWSRFDLERPLIHADAELCAVLDRHAQRLLEERPAATGFCLRVRQVIAERLDGGDVRAETIAAALRMSPRTLRRRLSDEDTTYQQLLDGVRSDFAHRYLREEGLSVDEVAARLGFAEASSFRRAVKRWVDKAG